MFSSSTCMQGQSWCIGGDSNASTIASFLRFYTPDIQGASLGTHLASVLTHCLTFYIAASFFDYSSFTLFFPRQDPIYLHTYVLPPLPLPLPHTHCVQLCYGLFCPPFQYEPSKDVFNAAQSGAMIPNLVDHEFDYLYREVRDVSLCSIAVRLL